MIVKCCEVFPCSRLGSGMRFWSCFPLSSEKILLALRNTGSLIPDVSNMDLGRAATHSGAYGLTAHAGGHAPNSEHSDQAVIATGMQKSPESRLRSAL